MNQPRLVIPSMHSRLPCLWLHAEDQGTWSSGVRKARGQGLAPCVFEVARAKLEKTNCLQDCKEESHLERSGRKRVQKHGRSQEGSEKVQGTQSSGSWCVWGCLDFICKCLMHVYQSPSPFTCRRRAGGASPEIHCYCAMSALG